MFHTIERIIATCFVLIIVVTITVDKTSITVGAAQIEHATSYDMAKTENMLSLPILNDSFKSQISTNQVSNLHILDGFTNSRNIVASQLYSSYEASLEKEQVLKERSLVVQNAITRYNYDTAVAKDKESLMEQRREELGLDSLTDTDINNLMRIVQAEAGVCDMDGKMIVANVILNRVRSNRFPDTISGVIFAPRQFSPVSNGRFYSCKVTEETKEAVERVLMGDDNSQGALFFMNRGASRSGAVGWFDGSLTYLFSKGNHEFFK